MLYLAVSKMLYAAILSKFQCLIKTQALVIVVFFLAIPIVSATPNDTKQSRVLFVISKQAAVYTDPTKLVQRNLHGQAEAVYQFFTDIEKNFASRNLSFKPDFIVTIGAIASETVMKSKPVQPVLSVLITDSAFNLLTKKYYGSNAQAYAARVSAICLDQPFQRSIKLAKLILPEAKIAGVMIGPSSKQRQYDFSQSVTDASLIPNIVNIELEDNPIHILEPIIKSSDIFIPVPDSRLVNIATAKWILELSYRHKVPVIAYSKTYLDAGALAAIYSSVENIAQQTAEFIRNEFNDDTGGSHTAAYFSIRFNSSVASNLNIVLENEQFYRAALEAGEG